MKKLLLTALLAGCGNNVVEYSQQPTFPYAGMGIDDAFFGQVLAFEVEWGHQVTHVDMFFVERINGPEVGTCMYLESPDYQRAIRIEKATWDRWPDPEFREILIFHELAHCVLDRSHDSTVLPDGCADSIMYPEIGKVLMCYRRHRERYLDELFGRN